MNEGRIRVSLVEDTEDIREALQVLINNSRGFECRHVYRDAESALAELPSLDIDVVLMDIGLPRMNGIDCMVALKKQMPQTQFMMSTVYDDDETIFSALASGAMGYLLKRTSAAQVLEALREVHAGGSPMSSEIARRVVERMNRNTPDPSVEVLTEREKQILDLLARGFLYKEIADELGITNETVKKHIYNMYGKLHVQNRTEALNKVYRAY